MELRKAGVAASALVLTIGVVAVADANTTADTAAKAAPAKESFSLIEVTKGEQFLNLNKRGDVGDEFIFTSTVYAADAPMAARRTKVGTDAGVCTLVSKRATQCVVTLNIKSGEVRGQITGQGIFHDNNNPIEVAVTGGSGYFYGLSGQVTATALTNRKTRLSFDVSYPVPN